jgi:hypothetical protein
VTLTTTAGKAVSTSTHPETYHDTQNKDPNAIIIIERSSKQHQAAQRYRYAEIF